MRKYSSILPRKALLQKIENLRHSERVKVFELLAKMEANDCKESYYDFFKKAWTIIEPETPLVDAPYLRYLCDLLDKVVKDIAAGQPAKYRKVIINIPPSMSKSTIVTKILPAWAWLQMPAMRIITASYSADLALDHTVKSRDIVSSGWYQLHYSNIVKLKRDQNAKGQYENTKTGRRRATGIRGGITGFHAHLFIVDDPQDPEKAESEAERNKALRFWSKTLPSRLLENGVTILVQQRLHEEDVTGYEIAKEADNVLHIKLPAKIDNKVRPLPEELSELYDERGFLSPRLDQKKLDAFKVDLGSFAFAGQYDQEPSPAEGNKVLREWFRFCDASQVPKNLTRNLWVDGAYTENAGNDPSGFMIASYDKRTHILYVEHFSYKHLEITGALDYIRDLSESFNLYRRSRLFFEPKASGHSMRQLVNVHTPLSAIMIKSKLVGDGKDQRIAVAAPKIEAGKVVLVRGSWNDEFINQLAMFPAAKYDEAVDVIGYAVDFHFPKTSKGPKKPK